MDASNLIYIVAIIIYFIYTALQQKKSMPGDQDRQDLPPQENTNPPRKKKTFEDLLREIRNDQAERERDIVISGEKPKIEERRVEADVPDEVYEEGSGYNNPYGDYAKKQPLVKLDDQVDIYDNRKILGEVEAISDEDKHYVNRYAKLLKSPRTVKDAVVVAEILNRKHF